MKFPASLSVLTFCFALTAAAQEGKISKSGVTGAPSDPFAHLESLPEIPDYEMEVDRQRGSLSISAEDGTYSAGSHFANWNWEIEAKRWGNYYATLHYESVTPKMGVNLKIGDNEVKSYAPRTSSGEATAGKITLGKIYLPKSGKYPVSLLTGDKSNGPEFTVKSLALIPAPESELMGQSIDGTIELHAKTATTYSEMMRYEPKPEKNCLGFWVNPEDWAEWKFEANMPGKFKVTVVQGCGNDGGSEVAVLVDDETLKFKVEGTGGFQKWKPIEIGVVEFKHPGEHKLAIKPLTKVGNAVMDIQKVFLEPIGEKVAAE